MPVPAKPLTDPLLITWAQTIRKDTTRQTYSMNLQRLITHANMSATDLVSVIKVELAKNDASTYVKLVNLAKGSFSETIAFAMICGLRRFLYDQGVLTLPRVRVENPERVKEIPDLSWDDGLKICNAASKPYNCAFKLILSCGWGIREFLTFNTKETWENVKAVINEATARYFKYTFKGRKRNQKPFYSLIPLDVLREIVSGDMEVPLKTTKSRGSNGKDGMVLDLNGHYRVAERYIHGAFLTAYHRALLTKKQGQPSPHSLRSAFRTRASTTGCEPTVAEFAMGHTIDALGYNRVYNNEAYMWSELKKIYGPEAASIDQLNELEKTVIQLKAERDHADQALRTVLAKLDETEDMTKRLLEMDRKFRSGQYVLVDMKKKKSRTKKRK
jgi:integrase